METKKNILLALMKLNIGGAETHVIELAKGLQKQNFNVIVVSNGGIYEKELEENSIKHYKVPLHNKIPTNVISSYFKLAEIIRKENIDLVHAHARIPAFLCWLLHKKMKIPFITTAHWTFNTYWGSELLTSSGIKYFTRWGQKTIAVSEDIKKYLINNYNVNSENIKVTINGIDTQKFSKNVEYADILEEFNLNKETKKIVYISRLDADRANVAFQLIDIVKDLYNEMNDIEVVIVGAGNVFDKIKENVKKVNDSIGKNIITLAGPRTDIYKFNSMADIFIGVSRAALEAMSTEKIAIVSANEGYTGIFTEEKLEKARACNFTCRGEESLNKEQFKKDIVYTLKEMAQEEKEKITSFGRNVVKQYYSLDKMVGDNIEVYNTFFAEKGERK